MKVCESQVHIFMQLDACTMRTTPFSPWSIKLSRLKKKPGGVLYYMLILFYEELMSGITPMSLK